MQRVAVVGATGYTGLECCRLIVAHPNLVLTHVFSTSTVGQPFSDVYPQFKSHVDLELTSFDPKNVPSDIDVLMLAVPHATSHQMMSDLDPLTIKIIDLSADFRLDDPAQFKAYYAQTHQSPTLMSQFVYGLPEIFADSISKSIRCANPGCYATSIILGLYPFVSESIALSGLVVDAKSGVSGAGRKQSITTQYCEVSQSFSAYSTGGHRHCAEIECILGQSIFFSPHLVPMSRGILSSIYFDWPEGMSLGDVEALFHTCYSEHLFVNLDCVSQPDTKLVSGSNECRLWVRHFPDHNKGVVFSALDNLLKGAAGQAIQNLNLMYGFDASAGLPKLASYL